MVILINFVFVWILDILTMDCELGLIIFSFLPPTSKTVFPWNKNHNVYMS